jgi:hypothetical protein
VAIVACEHIPVKGGMMIVCRTHQRRRRCTHCSAWAEYLCDARGCDVPICARCRIHVPPALDFCRQHRTVAADAANVLRLPFEPVEGR